MKLSSASGTLSEHQTELFPMFSTCRLTSAEPARQKQCNSAREHSWAGTKSEDECRDCDRHTSDGKQPLTLQPSAEVRTFKLLNSLR